MALPRRAMTVDGFLGVMLAFYALALLLNCAQAQRGGQTAMAEQYWKQKQQKQQEEQMDILLSNLPPGSNPIPYVYTQRIRASSKFLEQPKQAQNKRDEYTPAPRGFFPPHRRDLEKNAQVRTRYPDYDDHLPKTKTVLEDHVKQVATAVQKEAARSTDSRVKRRVGEAPESCSYQRAPSDRTQLCCFFQGRYHCLPNFVIIGAQKTGTTALYAYLMKHPNFVPAKSKEVHYFDNAHAYNRGLRQYFSSFRGHDTAQAVEQTITGEASPSYMAQDGVCRRIREYLPHAKIVAIVRDPIKRVWSEIQMLKRQVIRIKDERTMLESEADQLRVCLEGSLFNEQPVSNASTRERFLHQSYVAKELNDCMPEKITESSNWMFWVQRFLNDRTKYSRWMETWTRLRRVKDSRQWLVEWRKVLESVDKQGRGRTDKRTTSSKALISFLQREASFIRFCENNPQLKDKFLACNYNPMPSDISHDFLWRSMYAYQLQECYKWFPKSNVMVIEQDDLSKRTNETMNRVQDFLGLPYFDYSNISSAEAMAAFNLEYPDFEVATGWGKKGSYESIPDDVRNYLVKFFKPYNEQLFDLLGTRFSNWQTEEDGEAEIQEEADDEFVDAYLIPDFA